MSHVTCYSPSCCKIRYSKVLDINALNATYQCCNNTMRFIDNYPNQPFVKYFPEVALFVARGIPGRRNSTTSSIVSKSGDCSIAGSTFDALRPYLRYKSILSAIRELSGEITTTTGSRRKAWDALQHVWILRVTPAVTSCWNVGSIFTSGQIEQHALCHCGLRYFFLIAAGMRTEYFSITGSNQ